MKILEYTDLDTSRVKAGYRKFTDAIARDDFRAAQVKKLVNLVHGKFCHAKLDDANRNANAILGPIAKIDASIPAIPLQSGLRAI
jgi:hypothetical protein